MCQPTEAATPADRDEGAGYARALLERICAGAASPDDLATLMQFLHSGDLLHGFAVVIFAALVRTVPQRGEHDPR